MKRISKLFCIPIILLSCSENIQSQSTNSDKDATISYELIQADSYNFRRAYHGSENMVGPELDLFMNRNPEPSSEHSSPTEHPFHTALASQKLITNDNLNLSQIDTLPDLCDFQFSKHEIFQIERRLLENPKVVDSPSYELTFKDNHTVILVDTLAFGFPPDVTFFTMDLNKDEKQELVTVYRWYFMNGANFELNIYELKK